MNVRALAPWMVAAAGLALAALVFTLGPYRELVERLGTARPFDEAPATGVESAVARLRAMDAGTVELYLAHLRWDLLAMVGNLALLAGLLTGLARPWPRIARTGLVLALLAVAGDLLENSVLGAWLADPSTTPSVASVRLALAATSTKLASISVAALLVPALLAARSLRALRSRRGSGAANVVIAPGA